MDELEARPANTGGALLSRRDLIGRGAALGFVLSIPAAGTATVQSVFAAGPASAAAFTATQSATLNALVGRLVPADANGPSGVDAGAAAYIEKALGGALKKVAPLYESGLAGVDAYATATHGAAFAALPPDRQDAVIGDMESGKATGLDTFFQALREHTIQGMFGDPVYGGNKHFAGWELINYPGVRMPVPARYQRIGVTVPKAHKSTYAGGQFPKAKKEAQK
jgi:gluconate 2-dehydrogenase gamma chain